MSRLLLKVILLSGLSVSFYACSNSGSRDNEAVSKLSREDQVKFEQYMVQGEGLYQTHCANCHQSDGAGLRRLIPPLAQADFLKDNIGQVSCMIQNGADNRIVVNGIDYKQKMPAKPQLTPIEITQIITYVYNSWGNSTGLISIQEINKGLSTCQ